MSGPKRNPDKLNTIGIVVVGICGAVLVYVSIVALQAFYLDDSADVQMMADYGGQDTAYKTLRAQQIENLTKYGPNAAGQGKQTYRISIEDAKRLVVESAKRDPSNLVPALGVPASPTVAPIFGRPQPAAAPAAPAAPAPADGAAPAAGSTDASAGSAGSAAPAAGAGSADGGASAPMAPTGGQGPGGRPVANPDGSPAAPGGGGAQPQPKKGNAP